MPDTTMTNFPIEAKNPKDRPVTASGWSNAIVFVLQDGANPKSINKDEFIKLLASLGFIKVVGEAIDDTDAIDRGYQHEDWYRVLDATNLQSGGRTIRQLLI